MSHSQLDVTGQKAPWVGAVRGIGKGTAPAVAEADVAVRGRVDKLFEREAVLP